MIKATKNNSMLEFIDTDNPDYKVRYDLKDGKNYKWRSSYGCWREVLSINDFFAYTNPTQIIESFDNPAYVTFLKKIARAEDRCYNVGTFLNRLRKHSHLEHYALAGVKFHYRLKREISVYPKDVIRTIVKFNLDMTLELEDTFSRFPDRMTQFFRLLESDYDPEDYRIRNVLPELLSSFARIDQLASEPYNCSLKSLIAYLVYVENSEALSCYYAIATLKDYQDMQREICLSNKYDKYPRFLASIHEIVTRNYTASHREIPIEEFIPVRPLDLEYSYGKYAVVAPRTPQDVKDEGVQLHHCVGSYLENIVAGKTSVLFLRKKKGENEKDTLKDSLVTIEVQNKALVQASGWQNRIVSEEEFKFLKTYAKMKGLLFKLRKPIWED